jgi:hypothetical protein
VRALALALSAVAGSTAQVAIGEDVGAVHAPVCAAPVERDTARFEPADNRRARHAEQYGSLAGRKHLVWLQHSVDSVVHDLGKDLVDQLGCSTR